MKLLGREVVEGNFMGDLGKAPIKAGMYSDYLVTRSYTTCEECYHLFNEGGEFERDTLWEKIRDVPPDSYICYKLLSKK